MTGTHTRFAPPARAASAPAIRTEGLTTSYGEWRRVFDLNLSVQMA